MKRIGLPALLQHDLKNVRAAVGPQVEWTGEVQQLSWSPRLFLYKKFLSDEECEHLIKLVWCSSHMRLAGISQIDRLPCR